jgi:CDP-glucose 4,6-dehydratase
VLVTGHTGFKGAWLSLWLASIGARPHGYALDPISEPSLFDVARIGSVMAADTRGDLADRARLARVLAESAPSVVFHLAAQPLVRESYRDPLGTFATNVMGTAHVLEAVRQTPSVEAVVVVTTDKVYAQRCGGAPYREDDPLGGHDPYSASKAAAEIVAASYRCSFFGREKTRIATARAGNVIGGGDWAADRLIPDCVRAFMRGQQVTLRYPGAVRPWQHVLEPLSGYLQLAERLAAADGDRHAHAWNFGPDDRSNATVSDVAHLAARLWGGGAAIVHAPSADHPHEAHELRLDSARARDELGWLPRWSFGEALERTIEWYRAWANGAEMAAMSRQQIAHYQDGAPA